MEFRNKLKKSFNDEFFSVLASRKNIYYKS